LEDEIRDLKFQLASATDSGSAGAGQDTALREELAAARRAEAESRRAVADAQKKRKSIVR